MVHENETTQATAAATAVTTAAVVAVVAVVVVTICGKTWGFTRQRCMPNPWSPLHGQRSRFNNLRTGMTLPNYSLPPYPRVQALKITNKIP